MADMDKITALLLVFLQNGLTYRELGGGDNSSLVRLYCEEYLGHEMLDLNKFAERAHEMVKFFR
jgi:hypothetical protein